MPKKTKGNLIGAWAFLIGVILALIIGLFAVTDPIALTILFILGIVVGLLNIRDEEINTFLLAGVVLVIVSSMGAEALEAISQMQGILKALLVMFVPATVIVALKSVFSVAKA